jgi:MoxR-like ATPase
MKLRIGYPDRRSEIDMLAANVGVADGVRCEGDPIVSPVQLCQLQEHVAKVAIGEKVQEYLVDLGRATRDHKEITLGLSPRGLIIWQRVAQAHAHLRGRDFVTPDDIQEVAGPVLEVRLAGDFDAAPRIVKEILASVEVPVFTKQ